MTNLIQLLRLLQAVMVLLTGAIGTPYQPQAVAIATQSITYVNQALQEDAVNNPIIQPMTQDQQSLSPTVQPTNTPVVATPTPTAPAPQPQYTLEVVYPIPGKGLKNPFLSRDQIKDEENYVEMGLLVKDQNGNNIQLSTVNVTATDSTQNKTMNGTGTFWGNPHNLYIYPFHYEFHTPGDHIINFECEGITVSVTLHADPDTRP